MQRNLDVTTGNNLDYAHNFMSVEETNQTINYL